MNMAVSAREDRLLTPALGAVLLAQFLSAFADNALLIAAIQLVKALSGSDHLVPWLQASFVLPFVLFAALLGPFADSLPKGRVMLIANSIKVVAGLAMTAAALASGVQVWLPLAASALAGIGAAIYSPAKYGILTQLCGPDQLVKANGLMEGSTIVAILLGVLAGGWLADHSLPGALLAIAACYAVATGLTLLIPKLPAEHPLAHFNLMLLLRDFVQALATLLRDPWARLSLLGTSLFWGSGSTLRLLLFAWVPLALGHTDAQTPANLMGAVSIGIVVGAALAAKLVTLETVGRALFGGLLLGLPVLLLAGATNFWTAAGLLIVMGAAGGFFVVPLNAILQSRGHHSVGAGHAIAVQNFAENLLMFLLASLYGVTDKLFSPIQTTAGFGVLLLVAMLGVFLLQPRRAK